MPYLYINSSGKPHTKHSYSAGNDFDGCQLRYYLRRVLGWREKDSKARFAFGKALEESIQFFHEHDGLDAVQDFQKRWSAYKDANLDYTATEKDWQTCDKIGQDMLRLYSIIQPKLPIPKGGLSVWQREYSKEVFPGDPNYGGIEDAGRLDIVCYVQPDHPMLPKVDWKPEYGKYRTIIVDIKTAGNEFPEQPGMSALDTQLRRYSWLTGIRTVALLWFVKKSPSVKKGYVVTTLVPVGQYEAGEEMVVAAIGGDKVRLLKAEFMLNELDKIKDEEERAEFLNKYAVTLMLSDVTKQKIQFNCGIVSEKYANDAGRIAARQIVEIVNASKTGEWINSFGVRYPHDDRNDPYFRAFVLQDEQFKKTNFTRSDGASSDDLFQDEEI